MREGRGDVGFFKDKRWEIDIGKDTAIAVTTFAEKDIQLLEIYKQE